MATNTVSALPRAAKIALVSGVAAAASFALVLWLRRRKHTVVEHRLCTTCNVAKPRTSFSKSQWDKVTIRSCVQCRHAELATNGGQGGGHAGNGSAVAVSGAAGARRKLPRRRGDGAELIEVARSLATSINSDVVRDRMTVVVTTSPVQSNPNTDMIQALFNSFELVPGLASCNKIVVCDGVVQCGVNKYRSGQVTEAKRKDYDEYVRVLGDLARRGEAAFANTVVVRLAQRGGFGHAVKAALTRYATLRTLTERLFVRSWSSSNAR